MLHLIRRMFGDAASVCWESKEYMVLSIIIAVIVVLRLKTNCKIKGKCYYSNMRLLTIFILVIYLSFLYLFTVFRRTSGEDFQVNLRVLWAFRMIINGRTRDIGYGVIGNIVLFVPIGFLFPLARGKKCGKVVVIFGMIVSLVVEFLQLLLKRGVFEVDDVLHNTIGAIIGYFLFVIYYESVKFIVLHFDFNK